MLRSANQLKGFSIGAHDGDIGNVVEFYFDDANWTVRYLVIDTGGWLTGRKVLISPHSFGSIDWDASRVNLNLTKEQIQNSPSIDTDKPVSRQEEIAYYNYYNFPYYWSGPGLWGPAALPGGAVLPRLGEGELAAISEQPSIGDIHLRSTKDVSGYYIEANDGDIGHVDDFLIDDESWTVRYLVIDTRNWWPGKKVLLSPQWVSDVSQADSRVYVDLTREQIKGAPEYDENRTVNREYESRLYRYYGRSQYWSE